jgi:cell division protein ZapE
MPKLQSAFDQLIKEGKISDDTAQRAVLKEFSRMETAALKKPEGLLRKLRSKKQVTPPINGIYLWGSVGRGKSMLMDIYYNRSEIKPKQRIHFHNFMIDVHARIHAWRKHNPSELKTTTPIEPVAKDIAKHCRLLCLDEIQVTDVADAMILEQLFVMLMKEGVKVVFTSNRAPEDLYQGGIQRDRFMHFIRLIREQCLVLSLTDGEDYRILQMRALKAVYYTPANANNNALMSQTFMLLSSGEPSYSIDLHVGGRILHIAKSYGGIASFSFAELCEKPLGAADYICIAQQFHTLFIYDIPLLTPEKRNEAKRFVTLIDALYERKVNLICSAAATAEKLYPEGDGSFEFTRTASRLVEMQSERYLDSTHRNIKIIEPQYAQV